MKKNSKIENNIINSWRNLGFYYDLDDRPSVNQWRFYGSKKGLSQWSSILEEFINDPSLNSISAERHYGPYSYLEVMSWDRPQITSHCAGTMEDLKKLKTLIQKNLKKKKTGEVFSIDEYGENNEVSTKFFIMSDDFDPASMDELLVSNRQEAVNAHPSK